MESQTLNEQIEWEVRRVAAAFEVKEWKVEEHINTVQCKGDCVMWIIDSSNAKWLGIRLSGINGDYSRIRDQSWGSSSVPPSSRWDCDFNPVLNELMAHGLYCLGIEDKYVLSQLNHPLTAHEKLELRISMPREYWPQKWLDEEAT